MLYHAVMLCVSVGSRNEICQLAREALSKLKIHMEIEEAVFYPPQALTRLLVVVYERLLDASVVLREHRDSITCIPAEGGAKSSSEHHKGPPVLPASTTLFLQPTLGVF